MQYLNIAAYRPISYLQLNYDCMYVDFRGDNELEDNDQENQFHSCDGQTIVLNTTIKHVRKDGSSVALKGSHIGRKLWHKKFSQTKSLPRKFQLQEEDKQEILWDEIFVYLHKIPTLRDIKVSSLDSTGRSKSMKNDRGFDPRVASLSRLGKTNIRRRSKGNSVKSTPSRRCSSRTKFEATEIIADVWDTNGDKNSTWYRWYACTGADAVLLCIPLSSILRFHSTKDLSDDEYTDKNDAIVSTLRKLVKDRFLASKSKRLNYRTPPVLLVGTLSDRCEEVSNRRPSIFEEVSDIDDIGLQIAAEIGCCDFVHCSGLRGVGVTSVFEAALAVSLITDGNYRASKLPADSLEPDTSDCDSSVSGEVASPTYFKVHTFPRKEGKKLFRDRVFDGFSSSTECTDSTETLECVRPPPSISFPPPPESTPPSTRPNSSDYSSVDSCSVSHPDPATAIFDASPATNKREADANTREPDANKREPDETRGLLKLAQNRERPVPLPRKRILSDRPTAWSSTPSSSDFSNVSALARSLDSLAQESPLPKPRTVRRNPAKARDIRVNRVRRDSVFLKFLQGK